MLGLVRRSRFSANRSLASEITTPPPLQPPSRSTVAAASVGWNVKTVPRVPGSCDWWRSYYTVRPELQHFRSRQAPRWYHNPRTVLVVVIVGTSVVVSVYYGNLETVPYTKRSHFVLLSPSIERQLGEAQFNQLKTALRGKVLPPLHPDSVRVRLISKEIIEAVQRGFRYGRQWSDVDYASDHPSLELSSYASPEKTRDSIMYLSGGGNERKGELDVRWSKEDEVLDDKWVHRSRKDGEARGSQPATRHLEGLNWEVLVVRDDMVNAMCLPGGKIVVFTGLLDHFRSDAEIATVIGHEVGHAIARHAAEGITKNLWFGILQLILLQFFGMPDLINTMSNLLLRLPFSRRMEMEADYIGLLLIASAKYDPRVAPGVYEKLGQITGDSSLRDYLSTHPSSKKRAQLLSQAKVMEEALSLYRETVAGRHGVSGFL
ncbi:hypothetical protein HPP92_007982 [Vanilla planifolia]|uniref:Peptidase M48 domain-containing protein n=1 Tax=Vanilla planifolia TaxID=51239 RepID=A0A835RB91_VANPL|nr:hypothetical protein HPP92_007982 [Vanilla planifolia]